MAAEPRPGRAALDLELWLRSLPRRCALIAVLVLIAAATTTWQLNEVFSARRGSVDVGPLFTSQLATWLAWAVAGYPLVGFALWTARRLRYWPLFLLLQVPLSIGVAYGFTRLDSVFTEALIERPAFGERDSTGRPDRERSDGERSSGERRSRFGGRRSFAPWRLPRHFLTYWVVLGIGTAFVAFLRQREQERRAAELELRAARLRAELAEVQMDTLRKELNPHFLFNALHTVGGLIRAGDRTASLEVLAGIGELLRSTLDHGESQLVSLRDELALARRYLEIEGIRFGDRMTIDVRADDEALDARVPALLLLPLVENAVKYAVEPRTEGGHLELDARLEGDLLVVCVRDDGPGFPPSVLDGGSPRDGELRNHIGLSNVGRRLEMLYGADVVRLGNRSDGGAEVTVRIPAAGPPPTRPPEP